MDLPEINGSVVNRWIKIGCLAVSVKETNIQSQPMTILTCLAMKQPRSHPMTQPRPQPMTQPMTQPRSQPMTQPMTQQMTQPMTILNVSQ